jgi:tetratricopeptide (TPR) repeat protein
LAGAREAGDVQAEAEALIGLAMIANAQGTYDRARTLTEEALPLARAADGLTLALANWASAYALWSAGDLAPAEACGVEALQVAREIGAVALEIDALNVLGNIATTQRDLERALAYGEAALGLARQAHHLTFETRALLNLGHIAYVLGDFAAARTYGQKALERTRELGLQLQMVNVLGNLAQADLKLGDMAAARQGARELLVLSRELGYVPAVVVAVFLFGQILDGEGDETRALALYGLARTHPALEHQLRLEIGEEIARLALPREAIEAGLAAGEKLDFETVLDEILAGKW